MEEFDTAQIINTFFIVCYFVLLIVFGDIYVKLKKEKLAEKRRSKRKKQKNIVYLSSVIYVCLLALHLLVLSSLVLEPNYIWGFVIFVIFYSIQSLIYLAGGIKVINDKLRFYDTN